MVTIKAKSRRLGVTNTVGIIVLLVTLSVASTILVFNSGVINTINTDVEQKSSNIITAKIITNKIDNSTITGSNATTTNPQNSNQDLNETKKVTYYELIINGPEGSGTSSPEPGVYQFPEGKLVTFTTTPSEGWLLDRLTIDGKDYQDAAAEILMNKTHTVNVVFKKITYNLTLITEGSGSTNPPSGTHPFDSGSLVPVYADASSGWLFDHWIIDGENKSDNPIEVLIDGEHSLKAVFSEMPPLPSGYSLSLQVGGSGVTIPGSGTYTYSGFETIQVLAIPRLGWKFDHWVLDGVDAGNVDSLLVVMDSPHTLRAVFNPIPTDTYSLTVVKVGQGFVVKNSSQATYDGGTVVKLTATPSTGWTFSGWSGDATGTVNPLKITMDSNMTFTATFVKKEYQLIINKAGDGGGSIIKNPNTVSYTHGSSVTLTATPQTGSIFAGWSGGITSKANPLTITMYGNVTATATFVKQTFSLNINKAGTGGGSVSKSPNLESYAPGATVSLTATPEIGSVFAGWSGDLTGTANPATITMNSAKTVTASFTRLTSKLSILSPVGLGTTSLSTGDYTYNYGYSVQVTANPADGAVFDHWVIDGVTVVSSNPITLTMTSDHTLRPVFTDTGALGIFSDSACNVPLTSLEWGTLSPDTTIYKFVYIKNLSDQSVSLQCIFTCTPVDAANYIMLSWNRENTVLAPNASVQATFTLEVTEGIHDVTDFGIEIEIIGNLP